MPSVGVVVFTLREMQHIDRCVESVDWADAVRLCALDDDESVGIDSESDRTDWVLYLFGEEQVDAELSAALRDLVRFRPQQSVGPYRIRVRSRLLDRWIEASCWGPCPSVRLLPTGAGLPFEGWKSEGFGRHTGPILPGWISDHSFERVADGVGHVNALSSIWARGNAPVPGGLRDLTLLPAGVFSSLFFRKSLWLRGLPGFSIAVLAAYTAVATAMKCWERSRGPVHDPPNEP